MGQASICTYVYANNAGTVYVDPDGCAPQSASQPATQSSGGIWTIELVSKPTGLDDGEPGFHMQVRYIVDPVPKGAANIVQLIRCDFTVTYSSGKTRSWTRHKVDVVDALAGKRQSYIDTIALLHISGKICAMTESCHFIRGFYCPEHGQPLPVTGNKRIREDDHDDYQDELVGPMSTSQVTYPFDSPCNCCLQGPAYEQLTFSGLGSWDSNSKP